jgi:LPXTG-motif cell wall-anchored protein
LCSLYSTSFRMPARRSAAVIGAVVALAAGTLAVGPASSAHAAPVSGGSGEGKSTAVVLRTGLDVSLLNKSVDAPLNVSLNDVHAPADANHTALTAKLDGVDQGRPFNVLRADVATARATADAHRSEGYANLTRAQVHVPGLPLLGLIEVEAVTSKATCVAGKQPTADVKMVGDVVVLGKKVSAGAGGTTKVSVPGVGEVTLDLAKKVTTSSTAAATALELGVTVNPGNLNVADVKGDVTLVKATCQSPEVNGGSGVKPRPGPVDLAETGGSSSTPYIAGTAAVLVAAGGGALFAARRRKSRG